MVLHSCGARPAGPQLVVILCRQLLTEAKGNPQHWEFSCSSSKLKAAGELHQDQRFCCWTANLFLMLLCRMRSVAQPGGTIPLWPPEESHTHRRLPGCVAEQGFPCCRAHLSLTCGRDWSHSSVWDLQRKQNRQEKALRARGSWENLAVRTAPACKQKKKE